MDVEQLRIKIYSKIDELPTLPTVIVKLLDLIDSPKSDVKQVTETLSHDPALTSKILKVANSAYYGFPKKITSLERAIALLGFNMVKSLALSIGVLRSMPQGSGSAHLPAQDLWVHSLAVATAARDLTGMLRRGEDAEMLFITGLLHDMGKVVLEEFFPREFKQVLSKVHVSEGALLYREERRVFGMDHGQVGGMLLERWKFPDEIRCPIEVHHEEQASDRHHPDHLAALRIADALAQELHLGYSGNKTVPSLSAGDLKSLGTDEAVLSHVKMSLSQGREGITAFFQALT